MKRYLNFVLLLILLLTACSPQPATSAPPPTAGGSVPGAAPPSQPAAGDANSAADGAAAAASSGVLFFGIGVHVEPFGVTAQGIVGNRKNDYANPPFFRRQVEDLRGLAAVVEAHGGRLTIQAQSPFTTVVLEQNNPVLADLAAAGHEIGLHFHEDAHLGPNAETLARETWCTVLQQEVDLLGQASGVTDIRYWSGGNLYPHLYEAATCAGLEINGDWKNPNTQTTDTALIGVHPWRPAGGTDGRDLSQFAAHDPDGPVIFLPSGQYDRNDFASMRNDAGSGGAEAYFRFLEESLYASLEAAEAGQVNVFHFTVHPGEYRGGPNDVPFEIIDRFLTEVVDPLVAEGRIQWATFSEMADAYIAWEAAHPGVDPRLAAAPASGGAPAPTRTATAAPTATALPPASPTAAAETETDADLQGYVMFAVNVHDWVHSDQSAETILRLVDLFERYGVRGEFYFTAPVVRAYEADYPEVIARLRDSNMVISYHVRAPHPLVSGFGDWLAELDDATLYQTLLDYETYRLDMETGGLLRDEPGGYTYVARVFGRAPAVASAQGGDSAVASTARMVYASLGALGTVLYHESGSDLEHPIQLSPEGLFVRPADFSVARVEGGNFWWNLLDSPQAETADPVYLLRQGLIAWQADNPPRPPFVNVLIHENNFYRSGSAAWGSFYYTIDENGNKLDPLSPPFDLSAPDPSTPRSAAEQEAIWQAYEALVAYAAEHLTVITSEDLPALMMTYP